MKKNASSVIPFPQPFPPGNLALGCPSRVCRLYGQRERPGATSTTCSNLKISLLGGRLRRGRCFAGRAVLYKECSSRPIGRTCRQEVHAGRWGTLSASSHWGRPHSSILLSYVDCCLTCLVSNIVSYMSICQHELTHMSLKAPLTEVGTSSLV